MRNAFGRSWVEVDLSVIKKNYRVYVSHMRHPSEVIAVVKANAYGHGDVQIAKCLNNCGVDFFAVSNIDEGIRLRKAGVEGSVLVLGYTPVGRLNEINSYDLIQSLLSEDYAKLVADSNLPIKCHFAIDTGMRRIGLNADDPEKCGNVIRKYADRLDIIGLFTHLCVADTADVEAEKYTKMQIMSFEKIINQVSDLNIPVYHCMNSAGGLWYESVISTASRLGIVLYGLKPDYANTLPEGIKPVLSWKSVVSMVKGVHQGDTIGYGRSFIAEKEMRIATIPTGYADGYSRSLSNKGYVLINGKIARIVGRICMDQMMVDVTDISDVSIGTEVVLIGKSGSKQILADEIAQMIGTIGYEVVCGISERVDRFYVESGNDE